MNEPESPIMAKILIRFNFETEIYVRYRSEEIAPGVQNQPLIHWKTDLMQTVKKGSILISDAANGSRKGLFIK